MHTEARKTITTDVLNRCGTRGEGLLLQTVTGDATQDQPCCTQIQAAINAMAPHNTSMEDIQLLGLIIPTVCYDDRCFCKMIVSGDNSGTLSANKSQCLPFSSFSNKKNT